MKEFADPASIDRLLALLRRAWEINPNLRFGQLIERAYGVSHPGSHCFRNTHDDTWESRLQKWIELSA